jgi:hypothetical protein
MVPALGVDVTQFEVGHAGCSPARSRRVTWCWGPAIADWRIDADGVPGGRDSVPGSDNVKLAVGDRWIALLKSDGTVATLGSTSVDNLAVNNAPARIEGLPAPAIDVTVENHYLCALLEDHTAFCRGSDQGQRGSGRPTFGAAPLRG